MTPDTSPELSNCAATNDDCCFNCRFWVPNEDHAQYPAAQGTCHRRAPRVVAATWGIYLFFIKAVSSEWPDVLADEWCGEHEPMKTAATL